MSQPPPPDYASAPAGPSDAHAALMADAAPDLAPSKSHYVLDDVAWGLIREAYQSGATAKELSKTWRVAVSTLYGRASRHGWTKARRGVEVSKVMVARERERRALHESLEGLREAEAGPQEADPMDAARRLLRRAAGSALKGRAGPAAEALKLAESLVRGARLLSEAELGVAESRAQLLAEARQGLEDDPDYQPPGWRDGAEAAALQADLQVRLQRQADARGRAPPQRLPQLCWLPDDRAYRPLAEALGVAGADGYAACADFDAAVAAARAQGRGEAVDRALSEPLPLEDCVWLSDRRRAELAAEEAGSAEGAEAVAEPEAADWAQGDEPAEACASPWWKDPAVIAQVEAAKVARPPVTGLDEGSVPWAVAPRRPPGISGPLEPLT